MILNWGEAGSGRISHDFVTVVQTFLPTTHRYVAVADQRSKADAEKFAEEHGIPKAYGDYLSLAKDSEVDVVHVGTITPFHYEVALLLLEHGKHVLCEKPLTLSEKQTKKLFEVAERKNVFFMEGMWTGCFPAIIELKKLIADGVIGDVMFVSAQIGQALQHLERITSPQLGGGAIFDLGLYAVLFQHFVFKDLQPIKISVNGHLNSKGTDESCVASITYPGGKIAVITVSTRVYLPSDALIVGTKGSITVPDFWCPTKLIMPDGEKHFPLPQVTPMPTLLHHNSPGLAYEAEEVRQCIMTGKTICPKATPEESIALAKITDLLRKEIGVKILE